MSGNPRPSEGRRRLAVVGSLLLGSCVFLAIAHRSYPIERWLLWTYLRFLLLAAALGLSCISAGHFALLRGFRMALPVRERVFMSFTLGLAIFGFGICALGHLRVLGPAVFWGWPLACTLVGAPVTLSYARRLWRHTRRRRSPPPFGVGHVVTAFGYLGMLVVYAGIMSASSAGYDARWYHLALAEHYAAAGSITRFPEGFYGGAWPHLASWLYTWAFLGADDLFARIEQSLHVEFAIFAATLAGVPVLVRWILGGRRIPAAWVAVFTFPSLFLYDASLNGTSDHVLALWALGILLVLRRLLRTFDARHCMLFAVMIGAALSTKYQSMNVVAFPGVVFLLAAFRAIERRSLPRVALLVLSTGGVCVALWSPHWLKNLLWYGDPLYPMLRAHLADHPWSPGATTGFAPDDWRPTGPFWLELTRALTVLVSFSFVPHDWFMFHRDVPVFGSLFTLLLLPLVFLRETRRAWFVAAAALAGVFTWYWTFHQDRYLQALVPWMAAVVAAALVRLWEMGDRWIRGAVFLLVAVQFVWGADVPFFPTHVSLWRPPLQAAIELLSTGYRRDFRARTATGSQLEALAGSFPRSARVLVHESELRLGTGTQVITDARGAQGGIDYTTWRTPARIQQALRAMGATHLVWPSGPGHVRLEQRLSNEVAFLAFAAQIVERLPEREPALIAAPLPGGALTDAAPTAGVIRCDGSESVSFDELDGITAEPRREASPPPLAPDVWLLEERCRPAVPNGYVAAGRSPPFVIATRRH